MNSRYFLFAMLLTLPPACSNTDDKQTADPPADGELITTALDAAHQAYLAGDFQAVTERVRDVLTDSRSSELAKQNAYELLDKSYEAKNGTLPSTFTPPAGIHWLKYGVVTGASGASAFRSLYLYGRMADPSLLAHVTVRLLPDTTLLDSLDGNSTWTIAPEGNEKRFVLEHIGAAPPPSGVVVVRFALKDGTSSEGWFISHAQASSATPEVKGPLPSASLPDAPTVRWTSFHSPESSPFEHRTLGIWVAKDGATNPIWEMWREDYGDLTTAQIGVAPQVAIPSGDYWMSLSFGETRNFGPFLLSRDSRAAQGFHVIP